jgi:hypothetical protein
MEGLQARGLCLSIILAGAAFLFFSCEKQKAASTNRSTSPSPANVIANNNSPAPRKHPTLQPDWMLAEADQDGPRPILTPPPPLPPQPGHGGAGPGTGEHPLGSPAGGSPQPTPETSHWKVTDTNIELGKDPQIAVSPNFVVATTTGTIFFFDRKTHHLLAPTPAPTPTVPPAFLVSFEAPVSMNDFFAPLWKDFYDHSPNPNNINRLIKWPGNLLPAEDQFGVPQCRSAAEDKDVLPTDKFCNPNLANPTENRTAIQEFYDTRVCYDPVRNRFWVESAARNLFWQSGLPKGLIPKYNNQLARRFIAIAVSKTEDPRDGFWEYILVNDYADWPRMAVHGPFLILGHNGDDSVFLFDADALANPDKSQEKVKRSLSLQKLLTPIEVEMNGIGKVGRGTLIAASFGFADEVLPVVQHDELEKPGNPRMKTIGPVNPNEAAKATPTLLVGYSDKTITVFAFDPPPKGQLFPTLMTASLTLDHPIPWSQTNAVYRDSKIYLAGEEAIGSFGTRVLFGVRVIRIPVFRTDLLGTPGIALSKSNADGFYNIAYNLSTSGDHFFSYEQPAIEVNQANDAIIGSCRIGITPVAITPDQFPAAVHDIIFHGRSSEGVQDTVIRAGDFMPTAIAQSGHLVALDLSGTALDPRDNATVWIFHAFGDKMANGGKGGLTGVFAKVKP